MSQKPNYREQIDACRPGSDDLSLPALAELAGAVESDRAVADEFARAQRFDHAVSVAMHDVPLPTGLLERLEAKLAAADVSDTAESTGDVTLPPAPARDSRRRILAGAGLATAAAILLAVASQFWSPSPRRIAKEQLTTAVSQWIDKSAPNSSAWQAPSQAVPKVLRLNVTNRKQRNFTTAEGERAVVFDVTPSGRQQVLLFVVPTRHIYNVQTSPFVTSLTGVSGVMTVVAWQKDGTLYVLAVREGDGQKLDDYLLRKPLALAWPAVAAAPPA